MTADPSLTGRTIGRYQVLHELGRGGMAVVYQAYQPSLRRYVALKVLPAHLAFDRSFVERFEREARAAASLSHPNIVAIFDIDHHDGVYYIVMEYLDGITLKEYLRSRGPVPVPRAAAIVAQVADALDYAHSRGLIHRDVKPDNIFVGHDGHVTLTDFGIVKAASGTHLTATGMLMGTPEYMSPEQVEGEKIDHRPLLRSPGGQRHPERRRHAQEPECPWPEPPRPARRHL